MNSFPSGAEVLRLRAQYAPGTRVELTAPMQDPYAKLNAGERATVRGVDDAGHILCRWDAGSSLNLIPGVDQFKIVGVFTEEIKSQILEIRAEGKTNMFDITTVQRFAYEKRFFTLVNFIEDDRATYVHFILRGE
jgi:hypothetical protein